MAEFKKKGRSFNMYTADLSWGELEAIRSALEKDHADALSDELYQSIVWHMNGNLPTPGEDESSKDKEGDEGEGELLDAPPADEPTIKPGEEPGTDHEAPLDEPPGEPGEDGRDKSGDGDDLLPAPPGEE